MTTTVDLADTTQARQPAPLPSRIWACSPGVTSGPVSGSSTGEEKNGIFKNGYEMPSLRTPVVREPEWVTILRKQLLRQAPVEGMVQVEVPIITSRLQVYCRQDLNTLVLLLPDHIRPLHEQLLLVEGLHRLRDQYQWELEVGTGSLHVGMVVPGSIADGKVVLAIVTEARALVDAVLLFKPLLEGEQHPLHGSVWKTRYQNIRHQLHEYLRHLESLDRNNPPTAPDVTCVQDSELVHRFELALRSAMSLDRCDKTSLLQRIIHNNVVVSRRIISLLEADAEASRNIARFGTDLERQRFGDLELQRKKDWEDLAGLLGDLKRREKIQVITPTKPGLRYVGPRHWVWTDVEAKPSASGEAKSGQPSLMKNPSADATGATTSIAGNGDGKEQVTPPPPPPPIPTPQELALRLGEKVIGQSEAVRAMAIALHLHLSGTKRNGSLLMTGPTGCGKSHIALVCADIAKVPFRHVNAASLVPAGIVGERLDDVLLGLLRQCDGDKDKAERGILVFDEVDKLVVKDDASRYGKTILHQLLRLMDGCDWVLDQEDLKDSPSWRKKLKDFK